MALFVVFLFSFKNINHRFFCIYRFLQDSLVELGLDRSLFFFFG